MKRILLVTILLLPVVTPQVALGFDTSTRVVGPLRAWQASDLERFDPDWLQVKFVEGSSVLIENGRFVDQTDFDLSNVNRLFADATPLEMRPLFRHDRATLRAWKAMGEARSGVVGPDLSLWFNVKVDGGPEEVARIVNALNALDAVEIAHPVPIAEPAVIRSTVVAGAAREPADTPDFSDMQDYLYETPVGLNAPAAWIHAGGAGAGMKFIDVELCWTPDHEDFETSNLFYEGGAGCDPNYEEHGTAVLGEVIGQRNGIGVSGFAPDVQYGTVGVTVAEWPDVPHYFQEAVDQLDAGDVWLIELQMYPPETGAATPMEYVQANYDVIWTGTWSLGIVCIEAGANGTQDLDNPVWNGIFDRDVRDSGAIMVGAGTPTGRVAEWFTNWGTRMDAHAWGSQIVTTGYGDLYNGGSLQTRYTQTFGGTSGASPMVTGSALCLQGIAKAALGYPLDPIQLRSIINGTGIDHLDPTKEIGPRPDLMAASNAVLALNAIPHNEFATSGRLGYPNPFRATAEIRFTLQSQKVARVAVFDATGRRLRTLVDGPLPAGNQRLLWDGRDDSGRPVGSGVYFYRIDTDNLKEGGRLQRIR